MGPTLLARLTNNLATHGVGTQSDSLRLPCACGPQSAGHAYILLARPSPWHAHEQGRLVPALEVHVQSTLYVNKHGRSSKHVEVVAGTWVGGRTQCNKLHVCACSAFTAQDSAYNGRTQQQQHRFPMHMYHSHLFCRTYCGPHKVAGSACATCATWTGKVFATVISACQAAIALPAVLLDMHKGALNSLSKICPRLLLSTRRMQHHVLDPNPLFSTLKPFI